MIRSPVQQPVKICEHCQFLLPNINHIENIVTWFGYLFNKSVVSTIIHRYFKTIVFPGALVISACTIIHSRFVYCKTTSHILVLAYSLYLSVVFRVVVQGSKKAQDSWSGSALSFISGSVQSGSVFLKKSSLSPFQLVRFLTSCWWTVQWAHYAR